MQLSKIFLSETTRPRAFIFSKKHHLEALYQNCSNYAPGVKIELGRGSQFYIELYKEHFKRPLLLNRKWEFYQTQQELSLSGPLPKIFKWFLLVA